jgi:hypothetical protein
MAAAAGDGLLGVRWSAYSPPMADRHDHRLGFFTWIVLLLGVSVAGIVAGMVKIPPFFANREVQQAVDWTVRDLEPVEPDEKIVNTINQHLMEAKASRYWVENSQQRTALDMQLKPEAVTITRNGNVSMAVDVTYTQTMWVPILNRIDEQTFHVHSDGASKSP